MKYAILILSLLGAAWTLPKPTSDLKFKRLYVDPLVDIPKNAFPRILNGVEVVPHSIPYQAYLIVTANDGVSRWLCGGSLISANFVLTAGHCVDDASSAQVYLGIHSTQTLDGHEIVVASSRLIRHELYNEDTISNDVGLIELIAPVELNAYINVVQLPSRSESSSFEGDSARISGWGLTAGDGDVSNVLLQVNATVLTNVACHNVYSIVTDSQICTSGAGGVGSCSGDSGGPLVYDNILIGVVSYGEADCTPGYPSGFSRVTSFLDWILEHSDVAL